MVCETDQIMLSAISTTDNTVDGLTKLLSNIIVARHRDTLLGHRPPS